MMKTLLWSTIVFCLTGCSWFKGSGSDSSEAEVTHKESCKFDLTQAARVSGMDDADVIENVQFDPDCKVKIEFRQVTGDGVVEIEDRGGLDVLEHSVPDAENTEQPTEDL